MPARENYTQGHSASVAKSHGRRNADNTCQYFTPLLRRDMRILDVGCGPGSITTTLAALVPDGSIIGVDHTESIVSVARQREDIPGNCSFQVGDIFALPFEDDSFDVVHTSQVLLHLQDMTGAMKELRRVCTPGGFVACREADRATFMIEPYLEGIDLFMRAQLYNPTAGRQLLRIAVDVGFMPANLHFTTSAMLTVGEERREQGELTAQRCETDTVWRQSAIEKGVASEEGFKVMARDWRAWGETEWAFTSMPVGQIVCYK